MMPIRLLTALFCLISATSAYQVSAQMPPQSASYDSGGDVSGFGAERVSPRQMIPAQPFSRFAIGGGISPLGVGIGLTANLNAHLNIRATGNMFDQPLHFTTNGFHADAQLKLASVGTSIDVYPFHTGFRISPGILFYNQNRVTASEEIASGSSVTLNGDTFYSANSSAATGSTPLNGSALLNLHATRPAFTITGGWGNPLARSGHWSFPVEAGVALVGAPQLNVKLGGGACNDQAQTQCADIANRNNPIAVRVQNDLQSEIRKWTQNLEPLKTYPIVSGGVTYSFHGGRR